MMVQPNYCLLVLYWTISSLFFENEIICLMCCLSKLSIAASSSHNASCNIYIFNKPKQHLCDSVSLRHSTLQLDWRCTWRIIWFAHFFIAVHDSALAAAYINAAIVTYNVIYSIPVDNVCNTLSWWTSPLTALLARCWTYQWHYKHHWTFCTYWINMFDPFGLLPFLHATSSFFIHSLYH